MTAPGCTPAHCRCPYSHDEWQRQVVDLAHALGWQHLHVRRSIGKGKKWVTATNREGWPDLFLWHPRRGFAALELKVGTDTPTGPHRDRVAKQAQVLAELAAAGAAVLMAYPHDLPAVQAVLSGRVQRSGA